MIAQGAKRGEAAPSLPTSAVIPATSAPSYFLARLFSHGISPRSSAVAVGVVHDMILSSTLSSWQIASSPLILAVAAPTLLLLNVEQTSSAQPFLPDALLNLLRCLAPDHGPQVECHQAESTV